MANVQIYRIQILSNPYSGFVAGDVLDIFMDTALAVVPSGPFDFQGTGISVLKNGASYPSSGSDNLILLTKNTHYTVLDYGAQICSGTSLLVFSEYTAWPFATYYSLENHYSCTVNPPTCDLIVAGVPDVVPATDETTADGSITVVGSSSLTIQYKLGSDFIYNDGTAQTDGEFTGLLPGSYRIFLRDSANCAANVLAVVGVDNTFGPINSITYFDLRGRQTKIEITKRGYSGAVSDVCAHGPSPIRMSLRGEGSRDKFQPLMAITANVSLASQTDLQFLELYTNDPNLYRINYYKNLGSGLSLKLTTKVLPQQYSEEYKAPPYAVSVVSSDGLAELKDFYLIQDDGQKYYGTISLVKLVAHCLKFNKLELPIRVACNMYAANMDQTDSDDPFDQAYCDFERFYLAQEEPTLDFVLMHILKPFRARITQWDGRWNIVRVEEMTSSYDYRDFDKDGNYTTNGTYDPVKDIDFPANNGDAVLVNVDHNLEMRPGYGRLKVIYSLGLKPNILDNGDFRLKAISGPTYYFTVNKDGFTLVNAGYVLSEAYEWIDETNIAYVISAGEDILQNTSGGEAYIQSDIYEVKMGTNNDLKINIRFKVNRTTVYFGSTAYTVDVPYVKTRVRIKYGSLYLQSDGSWSASENSIIFYITEYNKFSEVEIVAKQPSFSGWSSVNTYFMGNVVYYNNAHWKSLINNNTNITPVEGASWSEISVSPSSGMNFDVRLYHAYAYHAQFQSLASLKDFDTYAGGNQIIPTGYKTELRDDFTLPSDMHWYELEENTDAENGYVIVRPNDYHATNNPRQWVRKYKRQVGTILGGNIFTFATDRIVVKFLTDGKEPIDSIIRIAQGEANNKEPLEEELILGSYSNLIVTETNYGISLGAFFPNASPGLTISTTNALTADIIYTGYLRDADGNGYENWKRDGVAELDKLHGIFLKSQASQYKRSWRLMRGSFYAREYFGFLDVLRNVNDSNRIYLPMGIELDDIRCIYSGELHELIPITGGSDGGGGAPYSSGFTTGFGSSGFN